jgi:hypothetical protein
MQAPEADSPGAPPDLTTSQPGLTLPTTLAISPAEVSFVTGAASGMPFGATPAVAAASRLAQVNAGINSPAVDRQLEAVLTAPVATSQTAGSLARARKSDGPTSGLILIGGGLGMTADSEPGQDAFPLFGVAIR